MSSEESEQARSHWRRQLVLTTLACALVLAAAGLLAASAALTDVPPSRLRLDDGRVIVAHPAAEISRFVLWPAVAAVGASVALLAATVAHSVRVASFTLRREG